MARCLNCLRHCEGLCCSMECYSERTAIMLEGVELLDALLAMVDKAAEARGARASALAAAAAPTSKPARPVRPQAPVEDNPAQPSLLAAVPSGVIPNGFDPAPPP